MRPPTQLHPRRITAISRVGAVSALALLASLALLAGCGTVDVTRTRVERAVLPAYADLYSQRAAILGISGVTPAGLHATIDCDRGGPTRPDQGAGADWICMVHYTDETHTHQDAKVDVQVKANSCYVASAPGRLVGLLEITDTAGHTVVNPVKEWDGCFDPNG